MPSWFEVRTAFEPSAMKYAQQKIYGHPEKVFTTYYFQELQSLTAAAADVQRNYINTKPNSTPTGVARVAAGGNGPGRVDTGEMRDAIKWSARKVSPKRYEFKFGWINGVPGYSIFQEYGTSHGIKGMHSIQYAREFALAEIKFMKSGGRGTTFGQRPTPPTGG
jgi:hypothetical protein